MLRIFTKIKELIKNLKFTIKSYTGGGTEINKENKTKFEERLYK